MSFLGRGKKCDLPVLAKELDLEVVDENMTVLALRRLITASESYDEEFVKALFDTIINTRKEDEIKEAERSAAEAKWQEMELAAEAKIKEMELTAEARFKKIQDQREKLRV